MPVLLLGAGVVALAIGLLVLATFGSRLRIGRLLGGTPRVTIDQALAIGQSGEPRYVRIDGRIDSEDEFEDELHRPLVFRRRRIDARAGSGWRRIDEQRREVDFEIRDGIVAIAIDHGALDEGLVVIPREAEGIADEAREIVGRELPDGTAVRLRIEQVSSVEHAIALGRPQRSPDGRVTLSAGLGRPLVLTTLESAEAMRILAAGDRVRPAVAAALLAIGTASLVLGLVGLLLQATL